MSEAISRRTFMAGAAATALAAGSGADGSVASAAPTDGRTDMGQPPGSRFDQPGNPSRKAHHAFAEKEYEHYQRMREPQQGGPNGGDDGDGGTGSGGGAGKPTAPNFGRTVDAVEEFGVDPSGGRPITEDIDSLPEDTLVVFPAGTFKISGMTKFPATKAGVVGASYKDKKPPTDGKNATTFVAPEGTYAQLDFKMKTGLVGGFVIDFTATKSQVTLHARSSGFVQYRDVVWNGLVDRVGSQADDSRNGDHLCAMQPDKGATSRVTRFVMQNNGIPGTKNIGGRNGFWCGTSNKGTAQIEDCVVRAVADNGVYGGRTMGDVQIKGGQWINNEVSQNRFSGQGSFSDGATMIYDADNYQGPHGDYGKFNDKKGVNAVKVERGDNGIDKPSGAVVRNAEIRLLSGGPKGIGGGIRVRGSAGAVKIENCRITNNVDAPSVIGEMPGMGYTGYKAPSPYNITITDSLFQGTNSGAIVDVSERANSLVRKTCFKVPGASEGSVNGVKIGSGVGFGEQCNAGGLKAPKKVGSGGNLSTLSLPNASYSGQSAAGRRREKQRQKSIFKVVTGGFIVIFFMVLGMIAVIIGGIVTAIGCLAALLGDDDE